MVEFSNCGQAGEDTVLQGVDHIPSPWSNLGCFP